MNPQTKSLTAHFLLSLIPINIRGNQYFFMRNFRHLFFIWTLVFLSLHISAQTQVANDKNNSATAINDTLAKPDIVAIDINKVNELLKTSADLIIKLNTASHINTWASIDSSFSKKEDFLNQEYEDFEALDQTSLSKFFLENLHLAWASYASTVQSWQTEVERLLSKSMSNAKILHNKKIALREAFIKAEENDLMAIGGRISSTESQIDTLISLFNKNQQKLIVLQTRIAEKSTLCERVIEDIAILDKTLRQQTFKRTSTSIWNIQLKNTIKGGLIASLKRAFRNNYKSLKYYAANLENNIFQYLFLAILITFFILYIRKKYIALGFNEEKPGYMAIKRVLINYPGIILFTILSTLWVYMFPYTPMLLSDVLLFTLLLLLGIILKQFIDPIGKKVLITLIILLFFNILQVIIWYLGDYSRLYLFIESLAGIVMILPFITLYNSKNRQNKTRIIRLAKWFLPFVVGIYLIAFFANIFGFINVTVLFIKIGIRTATVTTIAYGYVRILETIAGASLSLIEHKFPDILIKYGKVIEKRIRKSIGALVLFLWAESIMRIFEIHILIHETLNKFFVAEATVGSISFSLSDVLWFLGILYFTYLTVTFIKTILEEEILRKMKMPRGIPAAISMILRISIVTFGILFAISATGVEMSSLGMIAGALGVGIGFGLQNIVQNFISGLILIFERPIQVGDTVEVDNLMGKVKDIGVRASNVVTYDGAEVVVPNSNLISNNLINWTLSDSRKRIEVKVGTAYGSDPNIVLELLSKVANEHPDIVKNPEPRALFDGFGDSSLDFRLLFWVSFELGLGVKSDVLIGIYNALADNNIEIPFPQVDLHVRDIAKEEDTQDEVLFDKKPKVESKKPFINSDSADDGESN